MSNDGAQMSKTTDWLLGIDLGASSIKTSYLDCDARQVQVNRHAVTTHYSQQGWAEQHPADWLSALRSVLNKQNIGDQPPLAIAISAGAHIPVLLDDDNVPLRSAILWSDQRSVEQAAFLRQEYQDHIHQICLNTPSATWTLPMLLWLNQHQPDIMSKVNMLLFAKDYIRFALTGEYATDPGDASGSMLYNQNTNDWDATLVNLAGLKRHQLPPIVASTAIAGHTHSEAEKQFGIPQGIPVITGSIDTTTELLTAAATEPNTRVIKLASAGVYSWITDAAKCLAPVSCYPHLLPQRSYFASGTNSCMTSVTWFGSRFVGKEQLSILAYDQLVAQSQAHHLPVFHPYLLGERAPLWNSALRASFSGISIEHDLADLAKAVYCGICYSIRHMVDSIGHQPTDQPIRVIGGGAHSTQLCSLLSSILDQQLITFEQSDASIGSAILAGYAVGVYNDLQQTMHCLVSETHNFMPNQQHQHHADALNDYLAIMDRLQ